MLGLFRKNASAAKGTDASPVSVNSNTDTATHPASLDTAISLTEELLMYEFSESDIRHHAEALIEGPIPFTTEELALCTALHFFRQSEYHDRLYNAQLFARMTMMSWQEAGLVSRLIGECFENTVYLRFKAPKAA